MIVYARRGCIVVWSGGRTVLTQDQPWHADAELVRARPELFADQPVTVHGRPTDPPAAAEDEPLSTATAAPGTKRRARARRKPAEAPE